MKIINSIIQNSIRKKDDKLNILCAIAHERYDTLLSATNHNFYCFGHSHIKKWDSSYAPLPDNCIILDEQLGEKQIPNWVDFDLMLIPSIFGHFQLLSPIAQRMGIPVVRLEHTMPTGWSDIKIKECRQLTGNINVFISENSRGLWLFDENDGLVIRHGIDTNVFKPIDKERKKQVLCVVNDYIGRGHILGWELLQQVGKGLPLLILGKTKGLSEPAESLDELINHYNSSRIFLNTSQLSPIPYSLLESAAMGCAIISTCNCGIPEFFTHNKNALLTNDPKEMREFIELLMKDDDLAAHLGQNARKMILEKCGKERFLKEWNDVFYRYIGE